MATKCACQVRVNTELSVINVGALSSVLLRFARSENEQRTLPLIRDLEDECQITLLP
jgi:hypothetical protein